jgi:hypothetical protein
MLKTGPQIQTEVALNGMSSEGSDSRMTILKSGSLWSSLDTSHLAEKFFVLLVD